MLCIGNLKFGEMEFGEMKRTTSNWSNFCMLLRRVGLSASAGLSCLNWVWSLFRCNVSLLIYIFMQKKRKNNNKPKWWFTFVDFPSVLRYCWLGLLTCKNRLPYNLYCVGGDVKHCTVQSNTDYGANEHSLWSIFQKLHTCCFCYHCTAVVSL